jgi:arsenate reductase
MKVLFVCVENAGRSLMAEAFANKLGMAAFSAGTVPSDKVNPTVLQVMKEIDIDLSLVKPKMLVNEMIQDADLVVTMGCSVEAVCPKPLIAQMQKKLRDWNLNDPKGKSVEEVRKIRDDIELKVRELSEEFCSRASSASSLRMS